MSSFALHLGNRSIAGWEDSKLRSYPNIKRKRRGQNPGNSMNGVDPPRGFAFAWFKIGNADVGVYSVHLKSNLIIRGDRNENAND